MRYFLYIKIKYESAKKVFLLFVCSKQIYTRVDDVVDSSNFFTNQTLKIYGKVHQPTIRQSTYSIMSSKEYVIPVYFSFTIRHINYVYIYI